MSVRESVRSDRNALDRALDELLAGRPGPAGRPEPLIEAAAFARQWLVAEVRLATAERHLAAVRAAAAEPRRLPVAIRPRRRGLAVALAATMLAALSASQVAFASSDAVPGDALYPVKRAVERLNLAVHLAPESDARLHLEFAARRLAEIEALLASGEPDLIGDTLGAFGDNVDGALAQVEDAGRPDDLRAHVLERLQVHIDRLRELQELMPDQARDAIANALAKSSRAVANAGGAAEANAPGGRLGKGKGTGKGASQGGGQGGGAPENPGNAPENPGNAPENPGTPPPQANQGQGQGRKKA